MSLKLRIKIPEAENANPNMYSPLWIQSKYTVGSYGLPMCIQKDLYVLRQHFDQST